jgi:hypothetical protein
VFVAGVLREEAKKVLDDTNNEREATRIRAEITAAR